MGNRPGNAYTGTPKTRLQIAQRNMKTAEHRLFDATNERIRAAEELENAEAADKPCTCCPQHGDTT